MTTEAHASPFAELHWSAWNHRGARAHLEQHGWSPCGEGDWAIALRSPDGLRAARISPFEPSYPWFLELCRRAGENPYLPRIDFATELAGGGHLTILEHLTWVGPDMEAAFLARWADESEPDSALRAIRAQVHALDEECRHTVPFWMGVDLGDHVMRAADGRLVLIDVVGVGGEPMSDLIVADAEAFFALIPREKCRYFLDVPHFSRGYAADQRARVAAAFAAAHHDGGGHD